MSLKFATPCAEQWYDKKTQGVVETDEVKMLQDFNIQTDHHLVYTTQVRIVLLVCTDCLAWS